MSAAQWKRFFQICAEVLGKGNWRIELSNSWCSFTTFRRLSESDAGYWTNGLPNSEDIYDSYIGDGGVWGQPFQYSELAHILIPRTFMTDNGKEKSQNLEALAARLSAEKLPFRKTEIVLEIKLY